MTAGLIAPFGELVAEGYRLFGIGADVVGLGSYIKQRLELVQKEITALPAGNNHAAPPAVAVRSAYAP